MAEKKKKQKTTKASYYSLSENSAKKTRKTCPKCGSGVFLAEHTNRFSCGKCGFTEWKTGGK